MKKDVLIKIAKKLRKISTPEEKILWYHLRGKRFQNFKFRRQFPVDPYIVDFICLSKRLVIELDGGQHNQANSDIPRTEYIQSQNFRILRFWNSDINQNLESVLDKIYQELQTPSPLTPLP